MTHVRTDETDEEWEWYLQWKPCSSLDKWYNRWREDCVDEYRSKVEDFCTKLKCEVAVVMVSGYDFYLSGEEQRNWLKENSNGKYFYFNSLNIMFEEEEDAVAFLLTFR